MVIIPRVVIKKALRQNFEAGFFFCDILTSKAVVFPLFRKKIDARNQQELALRWKPTDHPVDRLVEQIGAFKHYIKNQDR